MQFRFWALTLASGISKLGNQLLYVAIPWVVLSTTHSPALAVLSLAAQTVPYILSPVLGGIVDRYDRRRVFTLSETTQAVCVGLLPLLFFANQIYTAFVVLGISGLGAVVSGLTSDYGLIPSIVTPDRLNQANSTYSTVVQIGRLIGPAAAGLLIHVVGSAWTIWLDAASFLATAGVAFVLPLNLHSRSPGNLQFFSEGLRLFRQDRSIQHLTLALTLYNLGAGSIASVLLTVGGSSWHWSATSVGLALTVGAVMGTIGAWLAGRTFSQRSRARQLIPWLGVCAAGGLLMVIPTVPIPIVVGYIVLLAGEGAMNVISMTYRQESIPISVAGRVNSIIRMFVLGAIPISSILGAFMASVDGGRFLFLPAAAGALGALFIWRSWLSSSQSSESLRFPRAT